MGYLLAMILAVQPSTSNTTTSGIIPANQVRGLRTVGDAVAWIKAHPDQASTLANSYSSQPRPLGPPAQWIRTEDYPVSAVREHIEGDTHFQLTVDEQGKVSGCVTTISSGSAVLDKAACDLVAARALFVPAHDPTGRAMTSTYTNTIHWRVPEIPATPINPVDMVVTFEVNAKGEVSDCAVNMSSQGASPMMIQMSQMCLFLNDAKIALPPSQSGTAGKRHVTTRLLVTIDGSPAATSTSRTPN